MERALTSHPSWALVFGSISAALIPDQADGASLRELPRALPLFSSYPDCRIPSPDEMQLTQKPFAQGAAVAAKAPRASRAARCPVAVRAEKGEVSYGIGARASAAAAGSSAARARGAEMATPNLGARGPCPAPIPAPNSRARPPRPQAVDRRATLGLMAAAAALAGAKDAQAAYGDQARVFASTTTNKSGERPLVAR